MPSSISRSPIAHWLADFEDPRAGNPVIRARKLNTGKKYITGELNSKEVDGVIPLLREIASQTSSHYHGGESNKVFKETPVAKVIS